MEVARSRHETRSASLGHVTADLRHPGLDAIRFASYRTAAKLRYVQKRTNSKGSLICITERPSTFSPQKNMFASVRLGLHKDNLSWRLSGEGRSVDNHLVFLLSFHVCDTHALRAWNLRSVPYIVHTN